MSRIPPPSLSTPLERTPFIPSPPCSPREGQGQGQKTKKKKKKHRHHGLTFNVSLRIITFKISFISKIIQDLQGRPHQIPVPFLQANQAEPAVTARLQSQAQVIYGAFSVIIFQMQRPLHTQMIY